MVSVFDLAQSANELPSLNQGTSKLTYTQSQPLRDVTKGAFPGGEINFRWEVAGTRWWIPARSYMRMKCKIVGEGIAAGVTPVLKRDLLAPNMGLMANIFQSAELRIADKTVSRIDSYFAQVDAIVKRSNKSKAWLDSAGKLEWWQPDHYEREREISVPNPVIGASAGGREYTSLHPGNQASTLSVTSANPAVVTGINTLFDDRKELIVGDQIMFVNNPVAADNQSIYTVTVVTNNTTAQIVPSPGTAILLTANWVRLRRENIGEAPLRKNGTFDVVWQIPLSIFKIQTALPAMRVQLTLQPQDVNSFQKRAIESLFVDKDFVAEGAVVGADQFRFSVEEMHFYVATVEGPRVDNMTYYLSLDETRCQPQNVNSGPSLQQKNYDVSPSAYALSIAFQSRNSGVETQLSASKFKIQPQGAAFPLGQELAVDRLFLLFSGQNKPSPDADWQFDGTNNTYQQAYAETYLYNGGYFDDAGPESYKDWINRGWYAYYSWPRDGDDRSTRVAVNYKFSEDPLDTANVLLFDHYKRVVIVQVVDGRVIDIIEMDS